MKLLSIDFRNWSIKNKLKAVIVLTSLAVLLLLFLVFVLTQHNFLRSSILQEMDVLARNLANNCAASVIFDDHKTATETLESLAANPKVTAGVIYDANGKVFSSYSRKETNSSAIPSPSPSLLTAGHLFSRNHLDVVQGIGYGQEHLGTLYVRADLQTVESAMLRYTGFGFLGLAGAICLFLAACRPAAESYFASH